MKKFLLLLPALTLFLFSCSSDTEEFEALVNHSNARATQAATQVPNQSPTVYFTCFKTLAAHAEIDLSNGFGNGVINFVAEAPQVIGNFKAYVQIEQISDCEDLTGGNGNVKTFSNGLTYSNVYTNQPVVGGILPSQTFNCYRWRMVFHGLNRVGEVSCVNATPWYDAPLF